MGKYIGTDSERFDEQYASPSALILPPPTDFDMQWHEVLSRSEPSIQSNTAPSYNRSTTTTTTAAAATYNSSSSYKVSIGHETVNITEILPQRQSTLPSDPICSPTMSSNNERRQTLTIRKSVHLISLCFMCFVAAALILIALSLMHLFDKNSSRSNIEQNELLSFLLRSNNNVSNHLLYSVVTPRSSIVMDLSAQLFPHTDRLIYDLANVICLCIILLNCFCLLVFSMEIYLGCNMMKRRHSTTTDHQCKYLFSSSTSRFVAICGFYASIPALILVLCLFILMQMSLFPAIISLVLLGLGLIFILFTLLTYFFTWRKLYQPSSTSKSPGNSSTIYHPVGISHPSDDDYDLSKTEELSTLV